MTSTLSSSVPSPSRTATLGIVLIGASWGAFSLSRSLELSATDPATGAETRLSEYVGRIWPILVRVGFAQEGGADDFTLSSALFITLDTLMPPEVIIASRSSGQPMSAIPSCCLHPERCVIGHPFDRPHLIPLVEVVSRRLTSDETVDRACVFYARLGKQAICAPHEVPRNVANRLQAASAREAVHLVEKGVASATDITSALSWSPGRRWALMGSHLTLHAGAGRRGMEHGVRNHPGPFTHWWDDPGEGVLTRTLAQQIITNVLKKAAGRWVVKIDYERDISQIRLLALREEAISGDPER
jgi:carnitine 3-dehydrogenase